MLIPRSSALLLEQIVFNVPKAARETRVGQAFPVGLDQKLKAGGPPA